MKKLLKILALVLLSLVGLWFLVGIGLTAYFWLACPVSPVVDDRDLRLEEPAVPAEENAYVAFLAAADALGGSFEDRDVLGAYARLCAGGDEASLRIGRKAVSPEEVRAAVDRILAARAEGISAFQRACRLPQYRLTPDSEGLLFPLISEMTHAQELLVAKAARARERGDLPSAFAAARDALRFSGLCRDNAVTIVECLLGCGLADRACQEIVRQANDAGVSDELLAGMAEALKGDFDERELFEHSVKCDYANFTSQMFDKTGDEVDLESLYREVRGLLGPGAATGLRVSLLLRMPAFARFSYNREMTRQDLVDVFRAGLAGRPPKEVVPMPASCLQPNWCGRLMVCSVVQPYDDLRARLRASRSCLRAARTAVAVRRHCRAHGGMPPPDLSALVPAYLDDVPRDPSATDRTLNLR